MKKRLLATLMAAVMGTTMLAGCSPGSAAGSASGEATGKDRVYRVGFVNIDDADQNCYGATQRFIAAVKSDEFKKQVGTDKVEAITADSAKDLEKQTTNVETMLTKGIDMLFLIGVDTEGNTAAVEACNREGVPVFMVGTEASGGDWKL